MIFFGFTGIAFFVYALYGAFRKNPIDWVAPSDFTLDTSYDDESEDEFDEEWSLLTDDQKNDILDKQLEDYYKTEGKASMLAWAYLLGFNKGKGDKND
tara:strand:+ start:674 stop:967 length:294 start_codon:yes stop_codon:yes gene_type:complete